MDPAMISLTVAGLLAEKALEAAGGKACEAALTALGRIAETIRSRFRGDQEVTETLDRLEAKPKSQARTAELAEVLKPRLEADPQLVAELARLIEQAKTDPTTGSMITIIQGNAQVGKVTTIGSAGDIHF